MTTSTESPDTLPEVGYTRDQLAAFILRQLGEPQWVVELSKQQALDAIQVAFTEYNKWRPRIRYGSVRLSRNTYKYLENEDIGTVVQVDFVDTLPTPTEIFYGNLISPAPLLRTGLDEYDSFMRWRRTWQRVMSVLPEWVYDDYEKVLYIHNPIERYHCGIVCHQRYSDVVNLDFIGAQWVREYSLAKARYIYGEILAKFGNAIPAPVKDLQLDGQKRTEANQQLKDLLDHLKGMQISTPLITD
jgi:hypothetical protein